MQSTPTEGRGFGRRLLSGGLWLSAGQIVKGALELCTTLWLARLLAPAQFGEVAMVASLMTLGHLVQDGGLSSATIQAPQLDRRQLETTFLLQMIVGVALGLCFALAAPLIAGFYQAPRLESIALALSLVFPIQALTAQPLALLARELRMDLLLLVEVSASVVGAATGLTTAELGWGAWALVARSLARPVAGVVALGLLGRLRLRLRFELLATQGLIRFGRDISLYNLVNYLARNLDDVLIGRFYGSAALGLYQRAYQLATAPLTQINTPLGRLATPALSRLADQPGTYRRTYLRFLAVTLALTMPLGGAMVAAAKPFVTLLLGEGWLQVVPLFTALGLLLFTQPIGHTTGWLFVSQGRASELLRWGLIGSSLSLLSFVIGLPFGALGVAWCYAVGSLLVRLPLLLWFVGRRGPVNASDVLGVAGPLALVGAGTFAVSRIALAAVQGPPWLQCGVAVSCALLGVAISALAFPEARRTLRETFTRRQREALT